MSAKSTYTTWDGEMICAGLAEGRSLLAVCEALGIPYETARRWEEEVPEHVVNATRARVLGCHAMADQMKEIADTPVAGIIRTTKADGSIEEREEDMTQHRRLQIDTRKWLLSRWLPKIYGDRTTVAGDPEAPLIQQLTDEQLAAKIASLQGKVNGRA